MAEIHRLENSNRGQATTEGVIAMLEEAIQDLKAGNMGEGHPYNKALIVLLHDQSSEERPYPYDTTWRQSGMSMTECVALQRVAEHSFLSHMGITVLPEDVT